MRYVAAIGAVLTGLSALGWPLAAVVLAGLAVVAWIVASPTRTANTATLIRALRGRPRRRRPRRLPGRESSAGIPD